MNTLEKEILEIFDVEFSIMDHKIINKFEDYYCDNIKISYEQAMFVVHWIVIDL